MWGSSALLLLLRLKLRGLLRRQWRRMRTPKGLALTLLGAVLFCGWFSSIVFAPGVEQQPLSGPASELRVRAFGLLMLFLSLSGALANRGLFLPKTEIERLFSAPVSRADLVRYRMVANAFRSLLGGVVLGLFTMRRMPNPPLAFVGVLLAMQTLPVLNQLLAIALGGLELRAALLLRRVGSVLITLLLLGLGLLVYRLSSGHEASSLPLVGPWLTAFAAPHGDLLAHPVLARLTLPCVPWACMVTADSLAAFVPWFLVCLVIHVLLVELCARLPIDFRELSLQTSARAAARSARRGGGVAALRASRAAAGWRIPWFFGRGPLGAIAWRKSAGIMRKAKGALWVALFALGLISLFAGTLVHDSPENQALMAPLLIAILGTIYLCSGLRFDFREDLERMDVIRAWPIAPARVFLATLLPEVVLVSLLLAITVLVDAGVGGGLSTHVAGIVLCLPLFVFAWVALDNAIFLLAPVRFVPGQDGMLQNAGRGSILMLLRILVALAVGAPGILAYVGVNMIVLEYLSGSARTAQAAGFAALFILMCAGDCALVLLGAKMLARFDVARDRG